jgi:predicted Zn-dependent protease
MASFDLSNIHFLIIDDFANYRSMLRSILVSCGARFIDDVANAVEAIKKVTFNRYDVILCDYNLGEGQNGQQLLEEIMHRQLIPYGTIYIMITAENTQSMVMAAVEYRPDGYLNKPFPKDLLLKRLEALVQKKSIMKDIYKAYNKNDYQEALRLADEKMAQHSKQALEIGKLKGEIALTAQELDIAEQVYDKALSVRGFQWAKVGKAQVLIQRENYEAAHSLLQEVIQENKNYIEAYDLLAQVLEKLGKPEEVQSVLSEATKISPYTIARQQHLAQVSLHNQDYETAEKSLKKAISQGKHSCFGNVGDNMDLAKLYLDMGKTKNAVQTITAAKNTYKKDSNAMLHTQFIESMTQQKLGNEDKARELFQQAINNLPGDISELPEKLKQDLINTTEGLGEDELAEALKSDLQKGTQTIVAEDVTKKYHYLLRNGEGMRLYNNNHIHDSINIFEEAANNLTSNNSVNLNAAQALLIYMKHKGKDQQMLEKARHYLDVCSALDAHNERYKKLELIYQELS